MAQTYINGSEQIKANSVTEDQVDSTIIVAAGTNAFTAAQSMGGFALTNVLDPDHDQDAATKKYVDDQISGLPVSQTWVLNEVPTGALNGINVTYTLAHTPASGINLYLNGVYLQPGAGNDYTLATDTITMLFAPATGDKLVVGIYYY